MPLKYIPLGYRRKERVRGQTKLSKNFHFLRSSASCLPSAARLDMADDQGKGKIVPRKGLFVQEHDFLSSIPSWDTFFHSAGGFQPPVQKSVNR